MIGGGIFISPIGGAPQAGESTGGFRSFFGRWFGGMASVGTNPEPITDNYIPGEKLRRRPKNIQKYETLFDQIDKVLEEYREKPKDIPVNTELQDLIKEIRDTEIIAQEDYLFDYARFEKIKQIILAELTRLYRLKDDEEAMIMVLFSQ